jgi:hypothetical protein
VATHKPEKTFIRHATLLNAKTCVNTQPASVKSGKPVGCAMPRIYGTVCISAVSQYETYDDVDATYSASGSKKANQPKTVGSERGRFNGA